MKKILKLMLLLSVFAVSMSAMSVASLASLSYSEWYYEKFGTYPDGTVLDWEGDPVYWEYLNKYDPAEAKRVSKANNGGNSDGAYLNINDAYWSGSTAKWDVSGSGDKYQVKLYRSGDTLVTTKTVSSKSCNFSQYITKTDYYWFKVRGYQSYGQSWTNWYTSDDKHFSAGSSSYSSGYSVSSGPAWNNRWVGSGDNWQVRTPGNDGFISNSWWQDPSTSEWYLIGCTNIPGRESYMSAGLFRDSIGNWYLLDPLHNGTYGKMVSGDSNGDYLLNYNGQTIQVKFNKNHDGTYGRIISDVNALNNVLGGHFEVSYVPPTAK